MSGANAQLTLPDDGIAAATIDAFIARWEKSGGSELANFQTFACELCDLLGLPRPYPSQELNELNDGCGRTIRFRDSATRRSSRKTASRSRPNWRRPRRPTESLPGRRTGWRRSA